MGVSGQANMASASASAQSLAEHVTFAGQGEHGAAGANQAPAPQALLVLVYVVSHAFARRKGIPRA